MPPRPTSPPPSPPPRPRPNPIPHRKDHSHGTYFHDNSLHRRCHHRHRRPRRRLAPPRLRLGASPCGEATTHAIAIRAVADVNEPHSHISTYCPRHYVATMFHILEVEAPLNGDEFDVLVSKHGPIAEWG